MPVVLVPLRTQQYSVHTCIFGSFCLDDYDYFLKVSILLILIYIFLFSSAKSVTKAMKEVASGAQRDEGSKWFFELLDKGKISLL